MSQFPALCSLELAIEGDGSSGPPIVLVHSSVSGPKQWRRFLVAARERFGCTRAVYVAGLPGHGETPGWPLAAASPTLTEYAAPLAAALAEIEGPLHLVGHSMGGSTAMAAAGLLGDHIARLVLFEPNLLFILRETEREAGREAVWAETASVFNGLRARMAAGDIAGAAEGFCDYWEGAGAWAASPQLRKDAFLAGFGPMRWELAVVMDSASPPEGWGAVLPDQGTLIASRDTRAPMKAIVDALAEIRPEWRLVEVEKGGHVAPITEPELVNPEILAALA